MLNDDFQKISTLYASINNINDIINDGNYIKNHNSKFEAVINAVEDIDKKEFSDEITDKIISNIKDAVEEIYKNKMTEMNKELGLSLSFEHCDIEKHDNSKPAFYDNVDNEISYDEEDSYDEPDDDVKKYDIKVNTSPSITPSLNNILNKRNAE